MRSPHVPDDTAPGRTGEGWWKSAVVYQIYPRSFADSNGDGIGDIRGVIAHLDHLAQLGVDVIWLSPVYASPQEDNGYDISDYYAVDETFGTLDDLDDLIAALHARGMKLVMDLVVNHTSDEHEWFRQSRSGPDDPKRDWYIWRSPRDGAEPNNWGSYFDGPAWNLDATTGQYFLHLFSVKQPDLNWDNPSVRTAIYRMMNWWLDRGIDGFRMDVISFISKHPDLPDGHITANGYGDGTPFYGSGPHIHEYLQEMHREVFAGREADMLTVGEMIDATPDSARLYTDPSRGELDMIFHFEHVGLDRGPEDKFISKPLDLVELKRSFARWQNALAAVGWNSLYWNNHDQPRVVSRFGNPDDYWYESATALATVLHLMRGTPYIYQGEELGMTNMPFRSIDDYRDIESLNYYSSALHAGDASLETEILQHMATASRDNARTPLQWDDTPHAGFTTGQPWIPVNPNYTSINAASQYDDPRSVFSWYQHLITLRHTNTTVVDGAFEMLLPEHRQLFAYTRSGESGTILVIANCSNTAATMDASVIEDWKHAEPVLGNYPGDARLPLRMLPWQVIVLSRRTRSIAAAGGQDESHDPGFQAPFATSGTDSSSVIRRVTRPPV